MIEIRMLHNADWERGREAMGWKAARRFSWPDSEPRLPELPFSPSAWYVDLRRLSCQRRRLGRVSPIV